MNNKLKITEKKDNGNLWLEFEGIIDEDVDFSEILDKKEKELHCNFDKITMINSCGIREWIAFLDKLDDDARVFYYKCPQVIIEQMNLVHGFIRKNYRVESFYAPYYCQDTDTEKKILLNVQDIKNGKAPSIKNDHGVEMEFDALEEQYFEFLSQQE